MQSAAKTVEEYLASLPEDRRAAIEAVRKVIKKNLDKGFVEGMQYGMIGYFVPHSKYPGGYHCDPKQPLPFAHVASQKNNISVYFLGLYMDPQALERFVADWKASGKKLDMGKSCVRFKRIEDASLEAIGAAIKAMPLKAFIAQYEAMRATPSSERPASSATKAGQGTTTRATTQKAASKTVKKTATKKAATSKAPTKKAPTKKAAATKAAAKKTSAKKTPK
ncbi:MAG: DUF1801 domain-containing protein [Planctomycetota bacterium]